MMKMMIRAEVPNKLAQQFLQHIRDFDNKHPGCDIKVLGNTDMSVDEMERALQINPPLPYHIREPLKR